MKLLHALKRQITASAVTLSVAVIVCGASAADLTVAQGDSQTISANATYGSVVVNGNLSVADGVTLTCTSLTVADNIGAGNTATLTVGDGATVNVSGYSATKIGVGEGRAEVYLGTGAYFRAQAGYLNFCYGYDSAPASDATMTEALLVVGTNATVHCDTDFCFGHSGNGVNNKPSSVGNSVVKAIVRLDKGAVISAQRINDILPVSEIVQFNGGRILQRTSSNYTTGYIQMDYTSKNSYLYLDGTNGCPITFQLPGRGKHQSFATYGSAGCRLVMRGDGGFLKNGAGDFPLVYLPSSFWDKNSNLRFLFTGDFVIEEGGFSVATAPTNNVFMAAKDNISRPVDLVVKSGAKFDFAGCTTVFNSIKALGGVLTNSSETVANLTVGVLDDGRGTTITHVNPGINIVKKGSSTLTLGGTDSNVASLDVQGGLLVLKDTARMGYPFYRFQVDGHRAGFNSNTRVYINELAFIFGGEDVTRPYSALCYDLSGTSYVNSPVNMLDDDLSTKYEDLRAAYNDERLAMVGVTIEYADCHPVDSYRWAPHGSGSTVYDPTAWRVFGGYTKDDLTLLDQVTGFTVTDVTDGWNATNFVCSYSGSSALHVGTLKLANGAKVEAAGAQIVCDTFTVAATGLELDLAAGAVLPLTAAQSEAKVTVDLSGGVSSVAVFNPEENGAIYITGSSTSVKGDLLRIGSCENAGNLAAWSVYLNGAPLDRKLCVVDGAVRIVPHGLVLSFR